MNHEPVTGIERMVRFPVTVDEMFSLDSALDFLKKLDSRVELRTRFVVIHSLYVAAPQSVYERWSQSKLGPVPCRKYSGKHTHIGNLTERGVSDELKPYVLRVGPITMHLHQREYNY